MLKVYLRQHAGTFQVVLSSEFPRSTRCSLKLSHIIDETVDHELGSCTFSFSYYDAYKDLGPGQRTRLVAIVTCLKPCFIAL